MLSNRSIAYGIAKACQREGATLAFTYVNDESQGSRRQARGGVRRRARCCRATSTSDEQISRAVRHRCDREWDGLDGLLHSIAFAPREALAGDFLDASRARAFAIAHDISSYSFAALAKAARPLMQGRNGVAADADLPRRRARARELQRDGPREGEPRGERALSRGSLGPEGTRVNAISAGPIKTLAAAGIGGFSKILRFVEQHGAAAAQRHDRRSRQRRGVLLLSDCRARSPARSRTSTADSRRRRRPRSIARRDGQPGRGGHDHASLRRHRHRRGP